MYVDFLSDKLFILINFNNITKSFKCLTFEKNISKYAPILFLNFNSKFCILNSFKNSSSTVSKLILSKIFSSLLLINLSTV